MLQVLESFCWATLMLLHFSASAAALWLCHAMQKLSGLPVASLHALGPHPRLKAMGFPQSRFSRVIGGVDFELPGTPHTFGLYGGESIYESTKEHVARSEFPPIKSSIVILIFGQVRWKPPWIPSISPHAGHCSPSSNAEMFDVRNGSRNCCASWVSSHVPGLGRMTRTRLHE